MSKNLVLYRSLVVGVLALFIGIGVQPAVAVIPNTSESDDCNLCPKKVSKSHLERLTTLLDRLDKYGNQLSEQSKLYPELEEKYQDFSNRFTILTLLNEILKLYSNWFLGYFGVICIFLFVALRILFIPEIILENLVEKYPALNELYEDISNISVELFTLYIFYGCISWPPWENGI